MESYIDMLIKFNKNQVYMYLLEKIRDFIFSGKIEADESLNAVQ